MRVTFARGATIKVSISRTGRCTQTMNKTGEESCPEELKSEPSLGGKSVVIHIYFFALHELFLL